MDLKNGLLFCAQGDFSRIVSAYQKTLKKSKIKSSNRIEPAGFRLWLAIFSGIFEVMIANLFNDLFCKFYIE